MIGCGHEKNTPGASRLLVSILAIAAGLVATSARSAVNQFEMTSRDGSEFSAVSIRPAAGAPESRNVRLAKVYKYEIPKAQRAPQTPQQAAPQSSPPVILQAPSNGGTINRGRSRQSSPKGGYGGGSSGSCELCRNSCYVNYRVRSNSSQFVPCMRACWSQLCRR